MSAERPASLGRSSYRLTARTAILAVVVLGLLLAAVFPLRTYLSERSQIGRLTWQAQVLEARNRRIQARIRQLHEPKYLQRLARQCLGMVKPGEVAFVMVPQGGSPKPASC